MIFATGGFAVGEIKTKSSSCSSAILLASASDKTPYAVPSFPISLTSFTLICSLINNSLIVGYLQKILKKWDTL